ncbi:glycoside hydrolase family 36 N-terminal domain-containing protein [Streptomyces sp. NPDC059467]|uniref:glycoside hydrolase family 36 N-terminal domain-containing protein n=1 Tax=Streptomyces sp. NPDC059467 TaxID=3346844 RepID=UPI003682379C
MEKEQRSFRWGHEALHLEFVLGDDGDARLTHLGLPDEAANGPRGSLPLVEVTATGHGRDWSGSRLVQTAIGGRLRHRANRAAGDGDWHTLTVQLHDPDTGLVAEVTYRSPDGISVLRSEVTLRNEGPDTLHLESVSSFAMGCLTTPDPAGLDAADLLWAENDWLAECRWQRRPLRLTTPDHRGRVSHANGRSGFALTGQGTWSSCGRLPMGGLTDRRTGRSWVWQIEHNGGGWRWECAERDKTVCLALFGPTDTHHGRRQPLEPGAVFRTVPVALSFGADGGPDAAFAALTSRHRCPQPEDSLDEVAFTMASGLLGRIHLSGLLPELGPEARALVHEAVAVYKAVRAGLPGAVPSWPLGLPGWDDPWIALALHTPDTTYLTVWRRPGGAATIPLRLPERSGGAACAEVLYPVARQAVAAWNPDTADLTVTLPTTPSAALLRITRTAPDAP